MTELKERRQKAIAELIREHALASQEEVASRLVSLGFEVTQATVSRDLEQLGALKVRRDGVTSYALPDRTGANGGSPSRLAAVLHDWVHTIDVAATIVVLKTPPGTGHLVGVALDESPFPEIVGTICGDDTIFAACRSAADALRLAATLRDLGR
ncbi:arginine repressor [Sphingomonas daechungensis]|uniref:arginine repressor n=1 Tax=Sphingomonas daechungensis TaxID=1176646 RepID=UPI0037850DC5